VSSGPGVEALRRVAYVLERALQPTYRVRAFRTAAATIAALPEGELARRLSDGTLQDLPGVGEATAGVVVQAERGEVPTYLAAVEAEVWQPANVAAGGGATLRAALRGDCHTHSDWSDGGSPIEEMALAARDLGHEWVVLTDHSPRLTVANGLTADRLRRQLEVVRQLNEELAPFRILTGIEVDILEDGSLDQDPALLAELDLVVASVHSKLRMASKDMTPRMIAAIANPATDVLGHCTGRNVMPRGRSGKVRPESEFDAELVFEACRMFGVAVEINSRPERQDPPRRLLRLALEMGCSFVIDTDAHAPGQLEWQVFGCARAEECEVPVERVVNARGVDDLLSWAGTHRSG
jgi:putative hydrolase